MKENAGIEEDYDVTDPGELKVPRPNVLRAMWLGARLGLKWAAIIGGVFTVPFMVVGLALVALGLGTGRGWAVPGILLGSLRVFLAIDVIGLFLGGLVGLAVRLLPERGPSSTWSAANRPVRLFRRREKAQPPDDIPVPSRRRRWPWFVVVSLLLVLTAAFGLGIYCDHRVDQRLGSAIAAADRDDPFWRLDDLMAHREPVPDAENGALVVAQAASLLPQSWPPLTLAPKGTPDPPPNPVSLAYDQIGEAPKNVRLDDDAATVLRKELQDHQRALDLARSVKDFARGRNEIAVSHNPMDTPLRHVQAARNPARLLYADAAVLAHDGDFDAALESCRAGIGIARCIGDEPFSMSQLVRIAIGGFSIDGACYVLAQREPSGSALARLQADILAERQQPVLLYGMEGERANLSEIIRMLAYEEISFSDLSETEETSAPASPVPRIGPLGNLVFEYQEAIGLEWLNEAVSIARRPVVEQPGLWKAQDVRFERFRTRWYAPYVATMPVLLMPALAALGNAYLRHQSVLGATAILLAAERHRQKTGAWPASVSEIDKAILPDPPLDPCSGKPYLIDHRDGQLFIHSIGPNRRDEHGSYKTRQYLKGHDDDFGVSAWDVARRGEQPGA